MVNLPSAGLRARVALDSHGFRTTHSLGQNFLLDDALLAHLLELAGVEAGENVLEIGPGPGVMTALLAERAGRVLAVELDERLQPVLSDVLAPYENVRVAFCDFMKADVTTLTGGWFGGEPYRVVANLPYYITADILLKLTACERRPESISIMVQKEAAERVMSRPGQKQWCALAAILRFYGTAQVLEEVPPECFDPAPHVTSCFMKISRHTDPPVKPSDEALFLKLIQSAFAMRRKTLANNLKSSFRISQEQANRVLSCAGVDEKIRGEALSLTELNRVCEALADVLKDI